MARPRVGLAHGEVGEAPDAFTPAGLAAVTALVARAIAAAGCDLPALVGGKSVLLKPNLVRPNPNSPRSVVTDERVILAVIDLVRAAGAAAIRVGDNPGYGLSLFAAMAGMADFTRRLAEHGAELVHFDAADPVAVANPTALLFDPVPLPRVLLEADVYINIPKMKTHVHTLVTLGIKNQYGLILDDNRMPWHRNDINVKIIDILRVVKPDLTVVDALWAVQGQAPLSGSSVPDMNVIAAGTDVCAVDAVCADLMGIAVDEVAMLRLAGQEGLGETDLAAIEVVGEDPDQLRRRFARPVLSSMGAYPAVRVIEGGACQGCLSALRHALDKLGSEDGFAGRAQATLYVGVPMPETVNLRNVRGQLWCFGACSAPLIYNTKEPGRIARHIPGCPPHILDFYKAYKAAAAPDSGTGTGKDHRTPCA
ncbi:protein of unknown function DUF362 [Desulfovibrio sp. DV]|uniref:DUF362 domain-containing protein n=1 Tax=Desulfovibrio sp. DV TaxID=1844708 RepID=UPI00094B9915|nr:DUF362 domain-containing protein [Desulfovibrio sp. DV]OLN24547.1 protein of unknown function DUF362 [Desulfovibrio sp. DV]